MREKTAKKRAPRCRTSVMYWGIKGRCEDPRHPGYKSYGAKGIRNFLTQNDIEALFIRDHAYELIHPSIDRINSYCDYTYENCQIISLRENVARMHREKKEERRIIKMLLRHWEWQEARNSRYSVKGVSHNCDIGVMAACGPVMAPVRVQVPNVTPPL